MSQIQARFSLDRREFQLDVDLNLPDRGVTALFGHSGSGKTTLLRLIAGLDHAPVGRLVIGDSVWQDKAQGIFVPPHRRSIGYVFQEASLFEHLSVQGNLAYGQKRAPSAQNAFQQDAVTSLLGIGALLSRRPASLSGGERQRVAIARALLAGPQLLLMDEPLAALDPARKQEILPFLERLRAELQIPMIYVSHSPDEVARLADHLVVMEQGRAIAQGPLAETLARLDLPIRLGDDVGAVIDATVIEHDARWHLARVEFPGGALWVRDAGQPIGHRLRVRILARDVSLSHQAPLGSSILNSLSAEIIALAEDNHPAVTLVRLSIGGTPLLARISRRSAAALALEPGAKVCAQVKAVATLG